MNHSRYHVSSWLKFCFCSLAVIIFGTTIFPNEAYATEMVAALEIDLEYFDGDLDFLSSLPLEKRKQLYVNHRWDDGSSFMHRTKLADLNQLAAEINDNGVVSSLLLENTGGYLAIDQLVGVNTLQRMDVRFLNGLVTPWGEWRMTPLMALALMDTREHFAQKLAIFRSNNIDISQEDSFGNTAENMSTLTVTSLGARRFIDRNLDSSLWQAIVDDRYVHYLNLTRYCGQWYARDFANIGFQVVLMQPRTDRHRAFLQQDVSTQELRDAANDLWAGFFNVYDPLLDDEEREKQQKYSLRACTTRLICTLDLQDGDLQEMSANVIAGASSFPIKMTELSNEEILEAVQTTRRAIENLIFWRLSNKKQHSQSSDSETTELVSLSEATMIEEIEDIKKMFIGKKPHNELDEKEKEELPMYQLWCTVKALQTFTREWQRASDDVRFCNKYGFYDDEKVLGFVDETLKSHIPAGIPADQSRNVFHDMMTFPESINS